MTNKMKVLITAGALSVVAALIWFGSTNVWSQHGRLISRLRSPDPNIRADAAMEIGTLCNSSDFVPELIDALEDSNPNVCFETCVALNRIGTPAVSALLSATSHSNSKVRMGAAIALGYPQLKLERGLGGADDDLAVPRLVDLMSKDIMPEVRAAAAKSLGYISKDCTKKDMAVRALISATDDGDFDVQIAAIWSLATVPVASQEITEASVQCLAKLLRNSDARIRARAVSSLGYYGSNAKPIMSELANVAFDSDKGVKAQVWATLSRLSLLGEEAMPVLLAGFTSRDANRKAEAWHALSAIRPLPIVALPTFLEALKDDSTDVREAAVMTIGVGIGRAATDACGPLREAVKDAPLALKLKIGYALWLITGSGEEAVPLLLLGLADDNATNREFAAGCLGEVGLAANAALPQLEKLAANDSNASVRINANAAIGRIRQR